MHPNTRLKKLHGIERVAPIRPNPTSKFSSFFAAPWSRAVRSPGFSLFAGVWEIPESSKKISDAIKTRNFLFARSRAVTRTLNYEIYPGQPHTLDTPFRI